MNEREELAALRRLAELEAKAGNSYQETGPRFLPRNAVELGQDLREIPRQIGLTARYGLEAFGQTALPNVLGLPSPNGPDERVIGDAAKMLIGTGGIAKGAQVVAKAASPVVSSIGSALAANTGSQAATAIGAGVAGGSVREAGGGPGEQFAASLLGGVAAPFGTNAVASGINRAASTARAAFAPKDVTGEVRIALERAGVDWNALSNQAKVRLVADARKTLQTGDVLDPAALKRLADYRNIGATPLRGDITQDPVELTNQRNLSKTQANTQPIPGAPNLPRIENENAQKVMQTLQGVEPAAMDAYEAGARVQGVVTARDAALKAQENSLYRAARESAGRDIPLDRSAFVNQAFDNLANNNRGPWLPSQVRDVLNTLSKGEGQFTVDTIDQLKTLLAQESRASANGNVRAAISAVRDALENVQPSAKVPQTGSAMPMTQAMGDRLKATASNASNLSGETLGKFDAARATARERRTWQESAAFIEDALDGADPQKFTQKHIIGGELASLQKLRSEIRNSPEAVAGVRKQLLQYILDRGKADGDTVKFTSAGMKAALDQLGDRKLRLFFKPDELQQIKSAINVARYSQSQPIGSAVNNSNSGAMLVGRAFQAIMNASQAAPVIGPLIGKPLTAATVSLQGVRAANVPNSLALKMPAEPFPLTPLFPLAVLPSSQN